MESKGSASSALVKTITRLDEHFEVVGDDGSWLSVLDVVG